MQINEFIEATERLEIYYGKEYSKDQLKIMHEELDHLTLERYKALVGKAIRKCKYLPKVCDFIELEVENPDVTIVAEEEKIACKKCNSTGIIIYDKKITNGTESLNYQYAAICDCGNHKQYKGWEHLPKSDYYTPMAKELNLI